MASNTITQEQFLDVVDRDEAERRFRAHLDLSPLDPEAISVTQALGRVLASDIVAPLDVPSFDRANVDGFAVRAEDTFGAGEEQEQKLTLHDISIAPGEPPRVVVTAGTAVPVATGAVLPRGANAVVMIEYTDVREGRLLIRRPVAPGANITFTGTDMGQGETVLRRGELLTARETGVLAALGLAEVAVVRQPRVAIVSTGDELIPPGSPMKPGLVYDSNAIILADAVREAGGEPVFLGIVPDDLDRLRSALEQARDFDLVLLSGGTSKGAGDLSYRVVGQLGKPGIVAHGIALKPGKPLCLAVVERSAGRPLPIVILPGFPTSAIFTFREFVAPVIRRLAGLRDEGERILPARLPLRVNSERGRTEYLLVGLVQADTELLAYPMGKGSGSVTTFSKADGFVVIPRHREYVEAGDRVEVHLLGEGVRPADLVVIGSHCVGLDYLLGQLDERGFRSKFLAVGSTGGLQAARRGECDLAGIHLLDPKTDTYNRPFAGDDLVWLQGYGRLQGIVFRPGDPRFEGLTIETAVANALADPACVLVNRNRGSGTRVLIDRLLGSAQPPGFLSEARSHNAVSAAVVQGRADWGVTIATVARASGLGFIPMRQEQFDFVVPRRRWDRPALQAFRNLLREPAIRAELSRRGFHFEDS